MLDFGYGETRTISPSLDIELYNGLSYKITLHWVTNNSHDEAGEDLTIFNIHPSLSIIKPHCWQKFTVTFRPLRNCAYYFRHLQYFAIRYDPKHSENLLKKEKMKKTQENWQTYLHTNENQSLIFEEEVQPPLSGSIGCVGHSFSVNVQPFIPIIEVQPSKSIYFQPCSLKESVYTTILLMNKTDTHTYFKFSSDLNKSFRIFPIGGMIAGKSSQIILFEFSPRETKVYHTSISCSFNHNLSNMVSFKLYGFCCQPKMDLQNNGEIYFPPSFMGVISKQTFKVQNKSRIPIEYRIDVPKKYEEELIFKPATKILKPNETDFLLCSFIPYKKKNYKISIPVKVMDVLDPYQNLVGYHLPGSGTKLLERTRQESEYKIQVFGIGGDGSLGIEPKFLDFGIVKVEFNKKLEFSIENFSSITFYVEINIRLADDSIKQTLEIKKALQKAYKLDFKEGIIAGNSKLSIDIIFQPFEICEHDLILECIAKEKNPNKPNKPDKIFSQKCSLNVKAKGSYPQLKFIDVRNDSISVSTLWENFSIRKINKELIFDLTEDEKKFNSMDTLPFEEAQAIQKQLKIFNWNFGYLSNKKPIKPRKIVITIQNVGGTDLEWKFKWPNESQVYFIIFNLHFYY